MKNVNIILKEIANSIVSHTTARHPKKEMGLYSGKLGLLTFMAYYSSYLGNNKYQQVIDILLNNCCDSICSGVYYAPFGEGLSGMLYGLNHLNQKGYIDIDIEDVNNGYARYLRTQLLAHAKQNNFDFIHQATGIAIYLLQYGNSSDYNSVADYVKLLDLATEKKNDSVKWKFGMNKRSKMSYNISMSHGMSSIAIFLTKCIEKGVASEVSSKLLRGSIDYILLQEMDHDKYGSYFPYTSLESDNPIKSRMAWCYGDLGIAVALWKAGIVLNNSQWTSKAIEVMKFATNRRDLISNKINDSCLCHGTAGIAQLFRRMYYNTGDEQFLSASYYWVNETLKMSKWNNSKTAGFKFLDNSTKEWVEIYGILEGVAGVGLALIASQGDEKFSAWDEIMLLS
jgi:lantibiotic modifying enzyme